MGADGGYYNGYHGFQGELDQGALKGTLVPPTRNPPPPHVGSPLCRNPNFGLVTKARGCKVVGQEKDLGVTSRTPGSAKSVKEWTFTLPRELPCWELESQMDSRIFKARLHGSKPIALKSSLYHLKAIEVWMSKMGSHCPFGHLKHQVMPKRKAKSQIGNLTLNH